MESDDDEATTLRQQSLGGVQCFDQLIELAVHVDAQCLEGARGGMDLVRPRPAGGPLDGLDEAVRGGDRCQLARIHDGPRDSARAGLFAKDVDDVGKRFLRQRVHRIRRRDTLLRHAHVERAVTQEREAALGFIDLHGGHANVEHDAVDALIADESLHVGEAALAQAEAGRELRHQRLAVTDRRGIAVDGDDAAIGCRKNGARVTAGAEGAIDVNAPVSRRECTQHFGQHHGDMRRVGGFLRGHGKPKSR